MASPQSHANRMHYEAVQAVSRQGLSAEDGIDWQERHWPALTAEPGGVDYVEVDAGGVRGMWLNPKGCAGNRVILCMHGGGYVAGSIFTHRKMYGHLVKATGCRGLVFDYAYAHEARFPTQLEQTSTVYRWLLGQGVVPGHLALVGDSCGAALMFGVLLRARDAGLPLPAAAMSISGWTDMAATGASYEANRNKDPFFSRETTMFLASLVLGEGGNARDPFASPLYGQLAGLPPTFLQAGADETLLDDSRVFAERARAAGVEVRLEIYPGMLHSFQMMAGRAPEADEAIAELAARARPRLGLPDSTRHVDTRTA
jgi:monoterpene epsilon-lactone hydrolase